MSETNEETGEKVKVFGTDWANIYLDGKTGRWTAESSVYCLNGGGDWPILAWWDKSFRQWVSRGDSDNHYGDAWGYEYRNPTGEDAPPAVAVEYGRWLLWLNRTITPGKVR
jgi:hypothetical protein